MREATVTIKGHASLPRDVWAAPGPSSGDKERCVILDRALRLLKARPVRELRGLRARPGQSPATHDDMDAAIAEGATARTGRKR